MNKIVKQMFELAEKDKFRKKKKIKWDMYFLHMGYMSGRNQSYKRKNQK